MNQFARRREGDPVSEEQAWKALDVFNSAREDSKAKVVTDALAKGATQAGDESDTKSEALQSYAKN